MDEDEIRDSLLNTNDDEFENDTESSVNSLDVSDLTTTLNQKKKIIQKH